MLAAFIEGLPEVYNDPDNEECPICLRSYPSTTLRSPLHSSNDNDTAPPPEVAVQLPCGHILGVDCLKSWLEEKTTCPLCRADFMNKLMYDPYGPAEVHSPSAADSEETSSVSSIDSEQSFVYTPYPQSADMEFMNSLFQTRSRISPELVHIIYHQDWPSETEDAERVNRILRSSYTRRLYDQVRFYITRLQNARLPLFVSNEQYRESFVDWYNDNFRHTSLTADQEFDVFCWLEFRRCFDGQGFEFIRLATNYRTIEIYQQMLLANVYWHRRTRRWRTLSWERFMPSGFEEPD